MQDQTGLILCVVNVYCSPPQLPVLFPPCPLRPTDIPTPRVCWYVDVGMCLWSRDWLAEVAHDWFQPAPPYVACLLLFFTIAMFWHHQQKSWHIGSAVEKGPNKLYPTCHANQLIMLAVVNKQAQGKEQIAFTKEGVNFSGWLTNFITDRKVVMDSFYACLASQTLHKI